MTKEDQLCYCPACIVTRKGYGPKAECLRKKPDKEVEKDEGQTKLF